MAELPYSFQYGPPATGTATARDLVTKALRWLGILSGEEAASASELLQGVDVLNGMMAGFGPRGIAYTHTTLAATDVVNVPDEQVRNVMFLLGAELAPEYEVELSPARVSQVVNALSQLQAAYYMVEPAPSDLALRPHWPYRYSSGISRLD